MQAPDKDLDEDADTVLERLQKLRLEVRSTKKATVAEIARAAVARARSMKRSPTGPISSLASDGVPTSISLGSAGTQSLNSGAGERRNSRGGAPPALSGPALQLSGPAPGLSGPGPTGGSSGAR